MEEIIVKVEALSTEPNSISAPLPPPKPLPPGVLTQSEYDTMMNEGFGNRAPGSLSLSVLKQDYALSLKKYWEVEEKQEAMWKLLLQMGSEGKDIANAMKAHASH